MGWGVKGGVERRRGCAVATTTLPAASLQLVDPLHANMGMMCRQLLCYCAPTTVSLSPLLCVAPLTLRAWPIDIWQSGNLACLYDYLKLIHLVPGTPL